jgi:hypothetical protein
VSKTHTNVLVNTQSNSIRHFPKKPPRLAGCPGPKRFALSSKSVDTAFAIKKATIRLDAGAHLPGQKTGNLLLFGNKRLMNAQNKLTNGSGPKQTPAVVQGYTVCTNVLYTVCTKTGPHFVL